MSAARQFAAARILLHQQHQLLESQFGAGCVHAGDGAGMAGIDVAQVIECFFGAQLREQDPVRLHAQAGFQQLLRRDPRHALIVLGIEQPHVIGMPIEHQFLRVLDGDQALIARESRGSRPWSKWSCPSPSGPETRMFLRLRTARRMKASISVAANRRSNSSSVSSRVPAGLPGAAKNPATRQFLDAPHLSAGRRMAIATQPAVVAGGMTICTRSPVGSDADNSGEVASMRCCVELATSLAKRLHQSKSANGSDSRRQPARVSMNASMRPIDAQLHHVGIRAGTAAARAASARAPMPRRPRLAVGGDGSQFIDRPEIQIARHQHLNAVALLLHHRRRNVDGALQHLGHDILRRRRVDDDGAALPPLRRTAPHLPRRRRSRRPTWPRRSAPKSDGRPRPEVRSGPVRRRPGDASGTMTPVGVRASVHSTNTRADPCCTWPRVSPIKFGAALQQHDLTVDTEGIGCHDAGGHSRQRRIDGRFQGAVEERTLGQQQPLRRQHLRPDRVALTLGRSSAPRSPDSTVAAVGKAHGQAARRHRGSRSDAEYTTPDNWRSSVSCSGVLGCAAP